MSQATVPSEQLAQLFAATMSPENNVRRSAEDNLNASMKTPGHLLEVLKLVANSDNPGIRQSAAIHFKNAIKNGWVQEEKPVVNISPEDRVTIKTHLVQLMCTTPSQIQVQLSESISLIAHVDYPQQWDNLLGELVQQMRSPDPNVVIGVLKTADSIFKGFRDVGRSDDLYRVIDYTLKGIQVEIMTLLTKTGQEIEAAASDANLLALRLETLRLLCSIIYSLHYQDLPAYFEDSFKDVMAQLSKYLKYKNPIVVDTDEDAAEGPIDKAQAAVIQIFHLYGSKDEECFMEYLPSVTEGVWNLLMELTPNKKHDNLATTSIMFLKMLMEKAMHVKLFNNETTLRQIVLNIVIPNLTFRESDEEVFEDNPADYIVTEIEGSDSESRRRCSIDLLKAMTRHFETQTTAICAEHVGSMLTEYASDPNNKWQAKDAAIHLMMGIAIRRESSLGGVTEVNDGVNVLDFFSNHILGELQDQNHGVRYILKATCLKFVGVFRNQFTKDQLMQLIPLVIGHLHSSMIVVHTFAAYVLERFFVTKENPEAAVSPRKLGSQELREHLNVLFVGLFTIVENVKRNLNGYAMKCVMRALSTAGQDVAPVTQQVLDKLTNVLAQVAKNPQNPQFNHFLFESIAVLVKNACSANPEATTSFEERLFQPFTAIMQEDIAEFTPYVFQILSQLLEYRPASAGLGPAFTALFQPLLRPSAWERKGNVPALARLMQAYASKSSTEVSSHVLQVLGIFQKLLATKATEVGAFDLLTACVIHFPQQSIAPQYGEVFRLLLIRLQNSATPRYKQLVTSFFALFAGKYGAQALFDILESQQTGLTVLLLSQVWNVRLSSDPPRARIDAKITVVGLTRLLCDNPALFADEAAKKAWAGALGGTIKILMSPALASTGNQVVDQGDDGGEIGYDATYSRLTFATKQVEDPFPEVANPTTTFAQALHGRLSENQAGMMPLVQMGLANDEKLATGLDTIFRNAGLNT